MPNQCDKQTKAGEDAGTEPLLSFVVIGYNEEQHLPGCFQSVRDMTPVPGTSYEVIYVD